MNKFTIVLKNGYTFETIAEKCKIEWNKAQGNVTGYKFNNIQGKLIPLYINVSEIAAILQET